MAITVNLRYEYYLPFGEDSSGGDQSKSAIERFVSDDKIPEQDKSFIRS